ncbi:glycosyltransferase (plasmid) [Exiguobacterium sp. Helios]|uniref:tetratricopeptide repeat-containing glycosyltransferase n=1 Tax=Exiguobacterium sp. Helios TaxID=2735868 RepID=UPI00165E6C74|nr:glycosyltransferase [Exiguobacterium sp. Helios]QNR22515.1 glycosyltransferase [Exiguobacterium sp. Helios]
MSITACILVKDEPDLLRGCLEHLKKYVNEFVIVDSSNGTECSNISRKFNAKVIPFNELFPEKKNDYSESIKRNLCLDETGTEWSLILDCDERIHRSDLEKIETLIEKYQHHDNVLGFTLSRYEYTGLGRWAFNRQIPRLIRKKPELRYNQVNIHTSILPSVRNLGGEIIDSGISIHHYDNIIYNRAKLKRKIYRGELHKECLRKELSESELSDVTLFLGLEYSVIGETKKAEKLFLEAIRIDGNNSYLGKVFLAQLYLAEKRLNEVKVILSEQTSDDTMLTLLAEVHYLEGNLDKTLALLLKNLKINKNAAHTYINIASLLEKTSPKMALEFLRSALQLNPYLLDPILYKVGDSPSLFDKQFSLISAVRTFKSHVASCLSMLDSLEEDEKWNRIFRDYQSEKIHDEKKLL